MLNYIVDYYCAKANLVIEIDGSQHLEPDGRRRDTLRDQDLARLGLHILRFDNRQVLAETDSVVEEIYRVVGDRLAGKSLR